MITTVEQHWADLRPAIGVAASNPDEAYYVATYPSALNGLRATINKDENPAYQIPPGIDPDVLPKDFGDFAQMHQGSLPQLSDVLAPPSRVERAQDFAAVNLTGLVFSLAAAVGNLVKPRSVGRANANEFLGIVRSWHKEN